MSSLAFDNALLAAWQRTLAKFGSSPAILSAGGNVLRSFDEIESEAKQIARSFDGLPPASVVALRSGNTERLPAVLLALWRRRLIPAPMGLHMQPNEMALALMACGAAALVSLDAAQPAISAISEPRFSDAVGRWSGRIPQFLKLTSGTTSQPRVVKFRASQLLADCDNICATMGIGSGDASFGVIPFSHSYGFSHLITPLLAFGVRLCVSQDCFPRAVLDGLMKTKATVFPGMPVLFQKLADLENAPPLPKLRLCISAGAPLLKAAAEPFTQKFGLKIHTFYGASECGGIAYDAAETHDYEDGFLGTAMQGVEIERSDESGVITVRGYAVGDGYYPVSDEGALSAGRFVPGDLIRSTERGLFLAGRVSDVINVAGRKLNPLEVEARLLEFPGVRQAIVFGVRSALRGEEPIACVGGGKIDREALIRHCREQLSAWQVPRDVWIVNEIPSNERGKISRRALADRYTAGESESRTG